MAQDFRALLRERIKNDGGFDRAAARLECTSARLYQIVNDANDAPSFDLAANIESHYGIAMAEWKGEAA